MRAATQRVEHAQKLVRTIVYHVQKTWFEVKTQAGVAQFAHKDNFRQKENVASAIQIAKAAMVQITRTALTAPTAKHSTILLVLMSALTGLMSLKKTAFTSVAHATQSVILVMVPPWIAVSCVRVHFTLRAECALCSVPLIIPSMKAQELAILAETSVKQQEIRIVPFSTQMITH